MMDTVDDYAGRRIADGSRTGHIFIFFLPNYQLHSPAYVACAPSAAMSTADSGCRSMLLGSKVDLARGMPACRARAAMSAAKSGCQSMSLGSAK